MFRRGTLAFGLATALGAACAPPPPPSLEVEYAGCQAVLEGPVCVVPEDRRLRLWVGSDPGVELDVAAGGRVLSTEEVQGGWGLAVELDEGQPELVLRATGSRATGSRATATGGGVATWNLSLRRNNEPDWLTRARELDREDLEATRRRVTERLDGLDAGLRGSALRVLAQLDARAGDGDAAERHLHMALEATGSAGRFLEEIECRATLVYLLFYDNRLGEAREMLEDMPVEPRAPAEALFHRAYSGAVLANGVGDHQTALRLLDGAVRRAERLGLGRLGNSAQQLQAIQLQRTGRGTEAAELLARLWASAPEGEHACLRAPLANNIGWSRLLALESRPEGTGAPAAGQGGAAAAADSAGDPVPWLEAALDLFQRECPQLAGEPANVHTNLARAHLQAGRLARAREHLESSRRLAPEPEIRQLLWWLEIEARIALAESRANRALELYDDLAELAAAAFSADGEWRAAIGRGRAYRALGRMESARRELARGEALLDGASLQVPIVAGRASFVAQRELGTRLHLELLLDQDRPREAFEAARRSRSRVLRGLRRGERLAHLEPERRRRWEEAVATYRSRRQELDAAVRDAWRLPADELRRLEVEQAARRQELNDLLERFLAILEPHAPRAPALPELGAGDVRLIYHPLQRGWAAFADDAAGLQVGRLGGLEIRDAELARHLLEPFADKIRSAERVRVLPYGILRAIDFHALPFAGEALLALKPVVYGLDLRPPAATSERRANRGVVVADPGGDLAAARLEASHVRDTAAEPWSIELLEGAAADDGAVRGALATADLFHYAGHGLFAGWQSALPLAGSRLTLGDVLALEQAPARVVLSGCDTGRAAADAPAAGLAHAFLAAGSRSVIAATRPIADDEALALTSALYPALLSSASVPAALRRAQLELRRQNPGADWSSFRVFEP